MSADLPPPKLALDTAQRIERERTRLAWGSWVQYVDGVPFALALAVLMSGWWPALGNTPPAWCAAWFATVVAWSAVTSFNLQYYLRNEAKYPTAFWWRAGLAQCIAHGAIWGASMWVFWDAGNPVNQAILCTITLGLMVGVFFAVGTDFVILLAELLVVTAIVCGAFLYHREPLAQVFLVMLPLFTCVLLNYGQRFAKNVRTSLQLRFENETLIDAVSRANTAKSEFLASMSHELRTPLNAIIGYADMIRTGVLGPVQPARYSEYADDIAGSGAHLLKVINDILDLAKIEAGRRELNVVALRLSEVARDAVRFVEPQAARAHVEIMLDMKYDAIVRADERAVKQMLINLLSNAVKFSRPGGLAIVFCEISGDNRVAFGVKDTGVGMTAAMQEKALEPFTQAGDKLTVEGHGTGLGLPIVKGLVEAHQGRLKIDSTPGAGSRIWVEFPPERLIRRAQAAAQLSAVS